MAKKEKQPWELEQSTNVADYPTDEELGLNEPVEESVEGDIVLGASVAQVGNFTIRTTKPSKNDKYIKCYITKGAGGWSGAIKGSPTDSVADVLSNCVGYAAGRFCETYDEITGSTGCKYSWLNCNAMYFIERIKNEHPGELEIVDYPVPGSILVMGNPDKAGHVIFVERVNADGSIFTSESAYGSTAFYNKTRYYNNGHWGMNSNYYQRGFIKNPAVTAETFIVDRDPYVDQLKSLDSLLRIRNAASLSGGIIGFMEKDKYYNFYEKQQADGYTWYRIGTNAWCADVEDTLEVLPAIRLDVDRNTAVDQLKSLDSTLRVRNAASLSGEFLTFMKEGCFYNNYESKTADGYTWFRIGKDAWCANVEGTLELLPAKKAHKVVVPTQKNFTLDVDKKEAKEGELVNLKLTLDKGYKLVSFTVNGTQITNNQFKMPDKDAKIEVKVEQITYKIVAAESEHGTITTSKTVAAEGEKILITVTPAKGYKVTTVGVSKAEPQYNDKGEIFFYMPASNVVVDATFELVELPKHKIILAPVEHGVLEADKEEAKEGELVQVNVRVEIGYQLNSLTANGVQIDNNLFLMGNTDVKIVADITPIKFKVEVEPGNHGTVAVDKTEATYNERVLITALPDNFYKVATVSVSGAQPQYDSDGNIFFFMPMSNVIVSATFVPVVQPEFKVGDQVVIKRAGNSEPAGTGVTIFNIGTVATVSRIIWKDLMELEQFCYQLQDWDGTQLGYYREQDLELYHDYKPRKYYVGDTIKIKGKGNSKPDGSGYTVYGIGWKKEVLDYLEGEEYPYKIGKSGIVNIVQGYYREIDLESV